MRVKVQRQTPIHSGGQPMEKVEKNKWIFSDFS